MGYRSTEPAHPYLQYPIPPLLVHCAVLQQINRQNTRFPVVTASFKTPKASFANQRLIEMSSNIELVGRYHTAQLYTLYTRLHLQYAIRICTPTACAVVRAR